MKFLKSFLNLLLVFLLAGIPFPARAADTHLVTTEADSGPGSLRQAIADASSGDSINFDTDMNIHLASPLSINKVLYIHGTIHKVTISGDTDSDGDGDVRHFTLGTSANVNLSYLDLVNGKSANPGGSIFNAGKLLLNYTTLSGNTSLDRGGAIYNETGAILNIQNTTISDNSAESYGGAIDNLGTLLIDHVIFSENQVTNLTSGTGGAIDNTGSMEIAATAFLNNTSPVQGGAINMLMFSSSQQIIITNGFFKGNSAPTGGAIMTNGINAGTITINSSTIVENSATITGGGIYKCNNCVLALQNTIVANNTGKNCSAITQIHDGGGNLNWGEPFSVCPGIYADPLLGPLDTSGSQIPYMEPAPGSPAVDAVDANCPAADIRTVFRPQGPHCDIGAVEILTLSGNAGVGGATVRLDGGWRTTTSAPDGSFAITTDPGWTGFLTPSKIGYVFSPTSYGYHGLRTSMANQDFSAAPIIPRIRGTTGLGGVTLSYFDGNLKSVISDPLGTYILEVSYDWSGTVTPSTANFIFIPDHREYAHVTADLFGESYGVQPSTFIISGNAGAPYAILNYTDGVVKSVTADPAGNYTITIPNNWSGTVTPEKNGWSFMPAFRSYTNILGDWIGQNYTAWYRIFLPMLHK